jgi:hypothetical protein
MDHDLISAQPHELEYLARKHGTTVERVRELIEQTGSRSREKIEAALENDRHSTTRDVERGE